MRSVPPPGQTGRIDKSDHTARRHALPAVDLGRVIPESKGHEVIAGPGRFCATAAMLRAAEFMKDGFPTPDACEAVLIARALAGRKDRIDLCLREYGKPELHGTLDLAIVPPEATLGLAELTQAAHETGCLQVNGVDVAQAFTATLREQEECREVWSALERGLARRPTRGWTRIVLAVDPAHPAAELPWEALLIAGEPVFLDGRCQLLRTWPTEVRARSAVVRGEDSGALRVLVLCGDVEQLWADGAPDHLLTTIAADDLRELLIATRDELAELAKFDSLIDFCVIAPSWSEVGRDAKDLDEVRKWIRGEQDSSDGFDVLIFVGHSNARFDEPTNTFTPATALCFRIGSAIEELSFSDLAEDVQHTRTRVLLLQSCWTDAPARHALAERVEHVIGWGAPITPIACRLFTHSLFRSLAASPPPALGEAVRLARAALLAGTATSSHAWLLAHHARDTRVQAFLDADDSQFAIFRKSSHKKLLRLPLALARYAEGAQVLQELFVELSIERGKDRDQADGLRLIEPRAILREPRPLREWVESPSLSRRFLLAGEPGSGKSTLLRHLAVQLLDQGWVAVYVPIQVLLDAKISKVGVLACLADCTEFAEFGFLTTQRIARALTTGRFALFLDGLDEVQDRTAAEHLITVLAEQCRSGCVVVASRTDGLRLFDDDFLVAHVCELDDVAQRELVRKWFKVLLAKPARRGELVWLFAQGRHADDHLDSASELVSQELDRRRPLALVCRNPLALTLCILRIAAEGVAGLPASRYAILAWLTEFLLEGKHRADPPFAEVATPQHLLAYLALFLLEQGRTSCELLTAGLAWSKPLGTDFLASLPRSLRTAQLRARPKEGAKDWRIDDPLAWVFSSTPGPGDRTIADRFRASGLIEPIDTTTSHGLRFPIQSLADYLAAHCLRERFGREPAALRKWLGKRRTAIVANLGRWSETLALCTSWQADDESKHRWLVDLAAIDLRLGLRALGRADHPPVSAVVELLSRGDAREKLEFWDGFAQSFGVETKEDAERALELIEQVAPHLSSGTDRCLMEEEVCVAAENERWKLPIALRIRATKAIRGAVTKHDDPRAVFSTQPFTGEPLWQRIDVGQPESAQAMWIMAVPVTVGMYRRFDPAHSFEWRGQRRVMSDAVEFDRSEFENGRMEASEKFTSAHPVAVCWFEAVAFTRWLNALAMRSPGLVCAAGQAIEFAKRFAAGWRFRLPTEAEWEWACRAGTTTAFSCGSELTADHAWFGEGVGGGSHPVGLLRPNGFGLRDMHGNVWEWCVDAWASSVEPSGRLGGRGSVRVLRGGSSGDGAVLCRSACRVWVDPAFRFVFDYYGFRPVLAAPLPSSGSVIEDR